MLLILWQNDIFSIKKMYLETSNRPGTLMQDPFYYLTAKSKWNLEKHQHNLKIGCILHISSCVTWTLNIQNGWNIESIPLILYLLSEYDLN